MRFSSPASGAVKVLQEPGSERLAVVCRPNPASGRLHFTHQEPVSCGTNCTLAGSPERMLHVLVSREDSSRKSSLTTVAPLLVTATDAKTTTCPKLAVELGWAP